MTTVRSLLDPSILSWPWIGIESALSLLFLWIFFFYHEKPRPSIYKGVYVLWGELVLTFFCTIIALFDIYRKKYRIYRTRHPHYSHKLIVMFAIRGCCLLCVTIGFLLCKPPKALLTLNPYRQPDSTANPSIPLGTIINTGKKLSS